MKQEEKEILLNDSKGRLYTKTQCQCIWADVAKNGSAGVINELDTYILDELEMIGNPDCEYLFSDIKPYLRSMSSITEDEKKEIEEILEHSFHVTDKGNIVSNDWRDGAVFTSQYDAFKIIDFCNKHHLDYRGLIKLDLALEAPEGMYNF